MSTSSSTCWAPPTACRARIWARTRPSPWKCKWHDKAPEGKLDLLVTLDFRMSTTCLYSDIVLPTATWYEKNDLNTSDMHPFIHPLSAAVDPAWQARSDWEIYKGFAKAFSEVCVGHLGVEKEVVLTPIMHDTAGEMAQPFDVQDWKQGEIDLIPGKTAPQITVVERDYPNTFKRFTAAGPAAGQAGQRRQGHWLEHAGPRSSSWASSNGRVREEGVSQGFPKIESDIDATEVVLMLAPETNGHVACQGLGRAGQADRSGSRPPGAAPRGREDPFSRHPGAAAQDHLLADLVGPGKREGVATTPATPTCTS